MNFEAAAEETFQILRSYDYEVLLFNEEHNQVFEPVEARRFFAKPENLLVSIVDDGEDSAVRLYLSKSTTPQSVLGLISALRSMATKYKMIFHVRKYDRDLNPKDFATQASVSEAKTNNNEAPQMNITEGMYGTSRSSYLKLENARMIVRHSAKINENILGARGRNIDAIYIENHLGERHLFATTQLAPARAMAHHVDNGGTWADPVGEQISRMASDFASMGACVRHINFYGNDIAESAQDVRTTLRETLRGMRRVFEGFGRKTRYVECMEALSEMAARPLVESEDQAAKIAEFASLLNTEAVELSESVLGVVARVMGEGYDLPKFGKDREVSTVKVLGMPVSAEAWAEFKNGKIDLMVQPDISGVPAAATPSQRALAAFSAVAKSVKDNSLANLLNAVAEKLQHGGEDASKLTRIVQQTLRAAGLMAAAAPQTVAQEALGSEAIREFDAWVGGHNTAKIMEYDRFPEPDYSHEDRSEQVIADIAANFDYDAFMASASARDFHHADLGRLDPEEKEVDAETIVSAVEHYLVTELDDAGVQGLHPRAEAERLARTVITHMQEDGYTVVGAEDLSGGDLAVQMHELPMAAEEVDLDAGDAMADEMDENCGMCDGDALPGHDEVLDEEDPAVLTHEDVLLPRNEGDDLIAQVSTATVVDPDSGQEVIPDDGYVNRLLSLAGRGPRV